MVNINTRIIQGFTGFKVINVRLNPIGIISPFKVKIMRHKLIWQLVLINQSNLPFKVLGDETSPILIKFGLQATINRPIHRWKIFPRINTIAPVIQSEFIVKRFQIIVKCPLNHLNKSLLDILTGGSVIFSFIVNLIADDRWMSGHMPNHFLNDALGVFQKHRVGNIKNLPSPIRFPLAINLHHDLRIFSG